MDWEFTVIGLLLFSVNPLHSGYGIGVVCNMNDVVVGLAESFGLNSTQS